MLRNKSIIAIGMILLFVGLSLSPATAEVTSKDELEIAFLEDGKLTFQKFRLSVEELRELDTVLAELMGKMQSSKDWSELTGTINEFIRGYGRYPVIVTLLKLFTKTVNINNNVYRLLPFRQKAFVMSWGFANKLIPFRENQLDWYRPFTLWYYTGRNNVLLNSRTIIVDPYPFNIKTLGGRQIGLMRNFAGIYIYRHSTIFDKSYTFFIGYAAGIMGFDLSISVDGSW